MRLQVLLAAIEFALRRLSPTILKRVADRVLDILENAIEDSATEWDDRIIMPVLQKAREAFDIPDETQGGE